MSKPSFAEVAEWDWVVFGSWNKLHHVAVFDEPAVVEREWGGAGTTSCGKHADWLSIPGWFSRQSTKRCGACCAAVGFPAGVGSPKNDSECRPLVEAILARDFA